MPLRTRAVLALIGLLLMGISIAALIYAFAPVGVLHDSAPVVPTLLTLPPGGIP